MLTYKRRKPISGDEQPPPITITYKRRKPTSQPAITIEVLPEDLVVEILARLPGKQIGRCKCVCKPWRSMIGSRPFRDTYRRKNSGLLLCPLGVNVRLRYFHCPLRRRDEPVGEFNDVVGELDLSENRTNMVHGLICSFERKTCVQWVTLHNICTGEKMRILKPVKYFRTFSHYFLGYDSSKGVYKLLRITYHFGYDSCHGVEIITLRPPSGPPSTWRKLAVSDLAKFRYGSLVKLCSDDGLLCWRIRSDNSGLLVFDFNTERSRLVDLPRECNKPGILFRAVTRFGDSLVLWLSPLDSKVITCYVQEEDEGRNWRISKEFQAPREVFRYVNGMYPSSASNGEMLGMYRVGDGHIGVHYYSPKGTDEEKDVLFAGKIDDICCKVNARLFCFAEANHLYLPLNEVLRGGSA